MRKKMPKAAVKRPTFDEYKSIKDEIIEISELRFENILNKKFDAFRRDFKKELMVELDAKFDAMNSRFNAIDSRFDAIDSRFDAIDSKFGAVDSKFGAIDLKFGAIDSKIESVNSKIETLKWSVWSLPIVMTVLMALFTLALKYLVKI
jgi:tetrahydromethanopterin S-methyltransferase subunit G